MNKLFYRERTCYGPLIRNLTDHEDDTSKGSVNIAVADEP